MNTEMVIMIVRYIILFFLAIQVYMIVSKLMSKSEEITDLAKNSIDIAMGRAKGSYLSYDRIRADLSKYGVMYMVKDYNIEPATYIILKLFTSIVTGLLCFMISPNILTQILLLIGGSIVGFFLPDLLIRASNISDNSNMQSDILRVYTILKIHAKAGVYITDSLIECQRAVSNGRLKQALNEVNNNILSSRLTTEEATDQFNARFCNEQIDNLTIIIKQALQTGRSADLLEDISRQIEDNNKIRIAKKRDQVKRTGALIQVTFFGLMSAMLFYLVIMEMVVSLGTL